jgi:NADH dehydrogenase FAD-containing subunit
MRDLGVTLHTECDVKRITREGVWFKPHFGDKEQMIKADTVILAGVVEPRTELFDACKGLVAEAYTVGDVSGMGLIDKAVQEATAVVYGLG